MSFIIHHDLAIKVISLEKLNDISFQLYNLINFY